MARGRFITNEITKDKRINDLSDDTSRLAFTWLITFADAEGRTNGDPALVRSMLFPRRTDVTVEQMQAYIQEWQDCGLIQWYEAAGDLWISFPSFEKNQTGLRKDREPESNIPPPLGLQVSDNLPDVIRQSSGNMPEENGLIKVKLIKENLIKDSAAEPQTTTKNKRITSDPRSKHPAILALHGITGKYPPKELFDNLIGVLGESPDGKKLAGCRQEWVKRGYNPNAWTWALEWYKDGIPAKFSRNGSGPPTKRPPPEMTAKEIAAELRKGMQK